MNNTVYTFKLSPDWKLINELSRIDKFGGGWSSVEKREGQTLKQLKSVATVRSTGASTRIEGSKMTDDEVAVLINDLHASKLEERDQQEVAGYFETLDIISESFRDIEITETGIKNLHNILMRYSKKDEWHKGNYKQHSNMVEATNPDGSKYVVFQTTAPGFATEDAMSKLVEWYNFDKETHPLIRSALFVYDFLSIHPFQDGNGRLSRLLSALLLLKHGYSWIQYVSFEHEIENRKQEYYSVLMQCQRQRPNEDVYVWAMFFLDCLGNIQGQLMNKLETQNNTTAMSAREKKVYAFVHSHPGCKSGEIAKKLDIPLPTTKKMLADMVANKFLIKYGNGAGTNYIVADVPSVKKDLVMRFTNEERYKEFTLMHSSSFIELKKVIFTPLFDSARPDYWVEQLYKHGFYMTIVCRNNKNDTAGQDYSLFKLASSYYAPEFSFTTPIKIPGNMWDRIPYANEYPLQVMIQLSASVEHFDFDVMIVYDAVID